MLATPVGPSPAGMQGQFDRVAGRDRAHVDDYGHAARHGFNHRLNDLATLGHREEDALPGRSAEIEAIHTLVQKISGEGPEHRDVDRAVR